MSIRCPNCGMEYDVTLFSFGKTVRCSCSHLITHNHTLYLDVSLNIPSSQKLNFKWKGSLDDSMEKDVLKKTK